MSLIKCPEYSKEISDQASSCPNCGYTIKTKKVKVENKNTGCLTRIFITLIGLILIALISKSCEKEIPLTPEEKAEKMTKQMNELKFGPEGKKWMVESYLKSIVKDPDSLEKRSRQKGDVELYF